MPCPFPPAHLQHRQSSCHGLLNIFASLPASEPVTPSEDQESRLVRGCLTPEPRVLGSSWPTLHWATAGGAVRSQASASVRGPGAWRVVRGHIKGVMPGRSAQFLSQLSVRASFGKGKRPRGTIGRQADGWGVGQFAAKLRHPCAALGIWHACGTICPGSCPAAPRRCYCNYLRARFSALG